MREKSYSRNGQGKHCPCFYKPNEVAQSPVPGQALQVLAVDPWLLQSLSSQACNLEGELSLQKHRLWGKKLGLSLALWPHQMI